MGSPTLMRLLDDNLGRAPEYGGGLANHLPMALHALHALGASDAELERFAAAYVERKKLAATAAIAESAPARSLRLGDFGTFPGWRAHYVQRIAAVGPREVLVESLPALWPGVAAAAFHGPIRTAHACQLGHAGELAAALAYWAARWQGIEIEPGGLQPRLEIDDWLAAAEAAARSSRVEGGLISHRMQRASETPAFRDFAGALRPGPDALPTAARWAAGLYADTGNFTVLHVVTGCRAILQLSALCAPPPQVWHALAAAIVASGIGERRRGDATRCAWDAVLAAARTSLDDHVVKLAHACDELSADHGDDEFLAAAARAVTQNGPR